MRLSELDQEAISGSFLSAVDSYLHYYASGSNHTARAKRLDLDKFSDFLLKFTSLSKKSKLKLHHWDHSSVQRFVEKVALMREKLRQLLLDD